MLTTTKIKWLGSITLAGIFVILALIGGDWGTTYTANASVNANPTITSILPSKVPVRSPNKVVVIYGSIEGTEDDTAVRFTGNGYDQMLHPPEVYPDGLSVTVTDTLMTVPTVYTVTVVTSGREEGHTIPELPIWPFDLVSNVLTFTVFQADEYFLPIINR